MKKKMTEIISDAAERVYDIVKDDKYDVMVELTNKNKGVKLNKKRPTRHTIKWKAKNH
ncbi:MULTISPECIES: hypothetical protein [Enterococcus]|uniref:Uncharacterized protein n=1 Tax=Enterococcus alishanensis TaxID=1303817 RepID=A0ABS6T8D7_9ENTE|nr:hypothetical protein [Enterococcus alishanensis]MBV7389112.1 hypothetical protein [Enterococcus alishanensis]